MKSSEINVLLIRHTIIHTQIYMKLTTTAINGIKDQGTRLKLALALGFSEQWIVRVIGANKSNGPLTTALALKVIREVTGLSDKEILEEEKVQA